MMHYGKDDPSYSDGSFCPGIELWAPEHALTELGYPNGLPNTKWGYEIEECGSGRIWIDNPDPKIWDHASLVRYSNWFPPESQWLLEGNQLTLKAEVMIPELDIPHVSDPEEFWSRIAIAFQWKRIDGLPYNVDGVKQHYVYSEFDVYRHNMDYFHSRGSNVYEYHVGQLEPGIYKNYMIDVNDFFLNGYGSRTGWGVDFYGGTILAAWSLVVETLGSRISAAWKNVKLAKKEIFQRN